MGNTLEKKHRGLGFDPKYTGFNDNLKQQSSVVRSYPQRQAKGLHRYQGSFLKLCLSVSGMSVTRAKLLLCFKMGQISLLALYVKGHITWSINIYIPVCI